MIKNIAVALLLLLVVPSGALGNSPEMDSDMLGKPSPFFEVVDLSGKKILSTELLSRGKVTMINFWGIRCGACLEELPHLSALADRYPGNLEILGVNADAVDAQTLSVEMKKAGLVLRFAVVPDPDFRMVDAFKMMAAPLTVIIDPQGIVRYWHENYEPGDEKTIEETIVRLGKQKVSVSSQ